MKNAKLLITVLLLLSVLVFSAEAQKKNKTKKPVKEVAVQKTKSPKTPSKAEVVKPVAIQKPIGEKAQGDIVQDDKKVRDIVAFLEYLLNLLGSPSTATRDKEVVITESYSKIFRDSKVQVEDDLDEARDVITNKDVVAYLKDVDFFFQDARFEFSIEHIEQGTSANGEIFYKVSTNRNLKGTNSEGEPVNTTKPRFIEINYNPKDQDLKIESIYTNEFNEKEALTTWWKELSSEWQSIFKKNIKLFSDSVSLRDIQHITLIESLDISNNKYIQNIAPLGQLGNLKSLNLAQTNINDLTPIRNLTELIALNLSHTKIQDLSPLKYAVKLESLNISHTEIAEISVLQQMPKLKYLDISTTRILDFTPVTNLHDLIDLNLEATRISDLSLIMDQVQLTNLNLSKTNVQDLTPLKGLKHIVVLDLDSTHISDIHSLSNLENLNVLHANYTLISNLQPLKKLIHLEKIYCDQTPINRSTADAFMESNPNVLVIYNTADLKTWWDNLSSAWQNVLSKSGNTGSSPDKEELAKIINIDSINFSGNSSINNLEPLRKLIKLRVIIANQTGIHDLSPLQDHNEIRFLDFSETEVNDLSILSQFVKLKELRADKSKIEKLDPLYNLKGLHKLYVDNTFINDINAREFLEKNPTCLVVYKTIHLNRWWKNIPGSWKEVFRGQLGNDTTATRENLHKLVEQKDLHFKDAPINDLSALNEFIRLNELHFSGTGITEIPSLENIKALKSLHATNSPLQKIEAIGQISSLEDLDLSNTPIDDMKVIGSLSNLKKLNISGTQIKRLNALDKLSTLEYIDCSNTTVGNLETIEHMNLKTLRCYNTKVSKREIDNFKKSNVDCEVVYYR